MKETIERIQNWYKLHCDGDWEHSYGYSIATLDNPGWTIRIDLAETCLHQLEFKKDYQNSENELDWFFIKTENKVLDIACGTDNLKQVFKIFLDEIIPEYSDKAFEYEIYLPIQRHHFDIWIPAKAIIVNEEVVKLVKIPEVKFENIRVKDFKNIDFNQSDLEEMEIKYKVGDQIKISLEEVADGLILTDVNKTGANKELS